jgi:hypothetical protein
MADDPVFHVQISAPTTAELKRLTDELQPDLGCRPVVRHRDGQVVLNALMSAQQLDAARAARSAASIQVIENATAAGRERQGEVAQGNRFAARGVVPRGLGEKE